LNSISGLNLAKKCSKDVGWAVKNVYFTPWWAAMLPTLRATVLDQWFSSLEAWWATKN